jgi:hypothetical protein
MRNFGAGGARDILINFGSSFRGNDITVFAVNS